MYTGKEISKLMEAKGMNAYDLAPLLNMTAPGVYKMLKNEKVKPILYNSVVKIIESWNKESLLGNDKSKVEMIPKKEYDNLKSDYDRLQANYDRLEKNYEKLELQLYGKSEFKGKSKTGTSG